MIRRILLFAGLIGVISVCAGVLSVLTIVYLLPCWEPDPMSELLRQTPVRIWCDESARLLSARTPCASNRAATIEDPT